MFRGDLMGGFKLKRLGLVMEPEPGNPREIEGVLNPAAARGPDGALYLFPRLVARGKYSRIGIARVRFNESGDPIGVERLGIALEPEADYERRPDGSGGCEDPRITFVEQLQRYIMTYTAFSFHGPRIALALSADLFLSFAKTPHEAILVHVTCYAVCFYVIDFTCALDFGEAQVIYAYNHHVRLLSPEPMVVEQPQFTRVKEPTLLCNQVPPQLRRVQKTPFRVALQV
jgi:hypothetical protein